jgi:DNA-binding response OmpR family regulator
MVDTSFSRTILVVDDDESICEMLAMLLQGEGYLTIAAKDGQTAARLAAEYHPDLVLTDLCLPDLSGWELADTLRFRALAMPIVVITAADVSERVRKEHGVIACVAKPFAFDELLAIVERATQTAVCSSATPPTSIR